MSVYLDNAATTALKSEVLDAMLPYFQSFYGNPSSQHGAGREAKSAIETSRKLVAQLITAHPGDIVFNSGGTESNNMILKGAVRDLGVKHIITSVIEHHGILHTVEYLEKTRQIKLTILPVDQFGQISMDSLEKALSESEGKTLVSIMHANNEIGSMIDIDAVAHLCKAYDALFHSDTVQSFAHCHIDVQHTPIDFLSVAAHKFHGPKGVGFLYMRKSAKLHEQIHGGAQERGLRAGTENVAGIVGLAKAAELAYMHLNEDKAHILGLKKYLINQIREAISGVLFNGRIDEGASLYTVLSISLPPHQSGGLLLFKLDMQKIYVSGGSACSSGAAVGSHVMAAIQHDPERVPLRVSFSKYNTKEDIDTLVSAIVKLYVDN